MAPNTYLLYGHGSFDSDSMENRVPLPPKCKLHFAVNHLKEIGEDKMVTTANAILMHCAGRSMSSQTGNWWDISDFKKLIAETYDTPGFLIYDYIMGDIRNLYPPETEEYESDDAKVVINNEGKKTRLSKVLSRILGSPELKNRHDTVHIVWCGCRAMGFRRPENRDMDGAQLKKWEERRRNMIFVND